MIHFGNVHDGKKRKGNIIFTKILTEYEKHLEDMLGRRRISTFVIIFCIEQILHTIDDMIVIFFFFRILFLYVKFERNSRKVIKLVVILPFLMKNV